MKIEDNRIQNGNPWFKNLEIGAVFEYLDSFYIKTGVSTSEPNAVDLGSGAEDIIRLDAEVEPVTAELVITDDEREVF